MKRLIISFCMTLFVFTGSFGQLSFPIHDQKTKEMYPFASQTLGLHDVVKMSQSQRPALFEIKTLDDLKIATKEEKDSMLFVTMMYLKAERKMMHQIKKEVMNLRKTDELSFSKLAKLDSILEKSEKNTSEKFRKQDALNILDSLNISLLFANQDSLSQNQSNLFKMTHDTKNVMNFIKNGGIVGFFIVICLLIIIWKKIGKNLPNEKIGEH